MAAVAISEISSNRCFGGFQKVYSHESLELKCKMKFGAYIPLQARKQKVPVLYWLSGLTCTEQNFIGKAGAQCYAAEHGVLVIAPDTSPRGCEIEGEDDTWDFGTGAGFYVDATQEKWKRNYRMFSYITKELQDIVNFNFPVLPGKQSIFGHSMGGHGALICALKNPGMFISVSAFAPICNPTRCPWGQRAFSGYLGENQEEWKGYDATCLIENYNGPQIEILIDQGSEDQFLKDQLLPETFVSAAVKKNLPINFRMHEGYDHSYYFIASFIEDHFKHHVKCLSQ